MAKQKKVRIAFNKNRQKRTRINDLTRGYSAGESDSDSAVSAERVRAKGDLSRHRTVMQEVPAAGADPNDAPRLAVDLSTCQKARVIRVHGLTTALQDAFGREVRCNVRRILKTMAIDGRNVVAVGDLVWFRPVGDEGMIEVVEPRRGTLTRG